MSVAVFFTGEPNALITEEDIDEAIEMSAFFGAGWLIGAGLRRAYDRRAGGREGDGALALVGETVEALR